MKKKIAYLLTASMLLSGVMPVYGTPSDGDMNSENQTYTENVENTEPAENTESAEATENTEYAEDTENTQVLETEGTSEHEKDTQEDTAEGIKNIRTAKVEKGNTVKVVLASAFPVPKEQSFEVCLRKEGGDERKDTLYLPGTGEENSEVKDSSITFHDIEVGEYTLEVSGNKYETYSQSFQVKELTDYTVPITTGWMGNYA